MDKGGSGENEWQTKKAEGLEMTEKLLWKYLVWKLTKWTVMDRKIGSSPSKLRAFIEGLWQAWHWGKEVKSISLHVNTTAVGWHFTVVIIFITLNLNLASLQPSQWTMVAVIKSIMGGKHGDTPQTWPHAGISMLAYPQCCRKWDYVWPLLSYLYMLGLVGSGPNVHEGPLALGGPPVQFKAKLK